MIINKLQIHNFRNYDNQIIEFNPDINIFYGKNGQGKTNILESIYLCSLGKSYRTNKNIELIKFGNEQFQIQADICENEYEKQIVFTADKNKKNISINEIQIKKIGELMGVVKTVLFAPEHIDIIKDGPSYRRKFIDIALSQIDRAYFYDLQTFAKILKQKNALLKLANSSNSNADKMKELEIWNFQLSEVCAKIIKKKKEFIDKSGDFFKKRHLQLSDNKEILEIKYRSKLLELFDVKESNFSSTIFEKMQKNREKEIMATTSLYGPHRDEFEILLDGIEIKAYGSQGQVRTAALALKLGELDIIKENTGEMPILLLDDVFSELDEQRQIQLLNEVKQCQTIITCTSRDVLGLKKDKAKYFEVLGGKVLQI